MTRPTKNTIARDTTSETIESYVRRRAMRAEADYQDAKDKFAEAFSTNPGYAIEWHSKSMVEAQTRHVWWSRLQSLLAGRDQHEALAFAKEDADRQVESFFGSNSTCPWHNAMRRVEAETYNDLLRHAVPELDSLANEQSR